MGGSSGTQTQTTSTQPSQQQQDLINLGMPFAQSFADNPPQLPGFSPVSNFNQNQTAGQQGALNAMGAQQDTINAATGGENFLSSGAALNPSTNPGLADTIKYANEPIQQNYQNTILPSIASNAVGAGGYGGSREGVAEGLAARGEEQAIGSTDANLVNANYQNSLDQMTKAIALNPSIAGEQTIPALTQSGVGDVQQALDQAQQSYAWNAAMFPQEEPISVAEELMGLSAGIPGGSSTTVGNVNNSMSPMQMAVGGASIGSALFGGQNGMFPGGLAGLGSTLSGLGSGASSMLSSIFSGAGGAGSDMLAALMLA